MNSILCDNEALINAWYVVARSIEVGPTPQQVTVLGRKVVLYRSVDGVVAAPDRCPHREAPLSEGVVENNCLICPYHGWTFGSQGKCVTIPSSGEGASVPSRAHLAAYSVEERYGLVWICLGEPSAAIPTIAEEHDPAFRRINTPVDLWRTSATRMTDNFLDITHFPYVHIGTFGNAQDPKVPHLELEQLDEDWYGYRYEVLANNANLGSLASGQTTSVVERAMSTGFNLPFNVRSTIRYGTGLSHILLLLSTPVDDETSYFTFVVWRNDDFSISAEEVIRFDFAIGAEDKRMLEKLDGVLPLDATTLVSVQADKCSVEWRRRLVKLIAG
jgi:phenylpropionate dioxygenase-like ring-hydroxylating dioxygenase large terminal subunit